VAVFFWNTVYTLTFSGHAKIEEWTRYDRSRKTSYYSRPYSTETTIETSIVYEALRDIGRKSHIFYPSYIMFMFMFMFIRHKVRAIQIQCIQIKQINY